MKKHLEKKIKNHMFLYNSETKVIRLDGFKI